MLLDAPALNLNVGVQEVVAIIDKILHDRHWKNFQVTSLSLLYVPHYFFNFDVYEEVQGKSQTFSSQMAINAIDGQLTPIFVEIMKDIPVKESKEITHDVKFELKSPSLTTDETKNVAKIKVAGQMHVKKDDVTISGVRLVYIPTWQAWISLQGGGTKRLELDGVSGSPLNIQEVPEKERGAIELAMDTAAELTTPAGWVDYSKRAFSWGVGAVAAAGGAVVSGAPQGAGFMQYLLSTRQGHFTLLFLIALALVAYIVFVR